MPLSLILWDNCVGIIPISVSPINLEYLSDILPELQHLAAERNQLMLEVSISYVCM